MVKKLNVLSFEFVVHGYLYGSMQKVYDRLDTRHDEYGSMEEIEVKIVTENVKQITKIFIFSYEIIPYKKLKWMR